MILCSSLSGKFAFTVPENFQVARRLRAMVNNLVEVLPESRCPALLVELDLLDRTLEKLYTLDEDLAVAPVPDTQGLGGS